VTKHSSPLSTVIFDWDGTLLNSFEADARAYVQMFRALGMQWDVDELKAHYSPNWHNVYRAARLRRTLWKKADRLWMEAYREHKPAMQPYAIGVLRAVQRTYTLALVSSGSRARVRRQVREFHLDSLFRTKVCCEDAARRNPHPAPLHVALERMRIAANVCVYVGDAPEDIEMAHRAGMRAIGVLGGSPVPERLAAASPDAVIPAIRDLPRLLRNF
jgi:HAD superfamily hydrolase (TIGR01509 family)